MKHLVLISLIVLMLTSGCRRKPDPQHVQQQLEAKLSMAIMRGEPDQFEPILLQMNKNDHQQIANDFMFRVMGGIGQSEQTRLEMFEILLKYGANINYQQDDLDTVAHTGLRFGGNMTPNMLEWFIKNGYDINLKGCNDQTALSLCVDNANKLDPEPRHQMIRILLDNGADTNVSCPGKTPLLEPLVIWSGHNPHAKEQITWLVKAGADLEIKNKQGHAVLVTAIDYNKEDMAEFLLEHGASYNTADKYGTTLLFKAAHKKFIPCVKMLIAQGADVNKVNSGGYTPLHFAVAGGNEEIIKILLDNGAKVNVINKEGQTPLDKADNFTTCQPEAETDIKKQKLIQLLTQHGAKRAAELKETNT